MSSPLCDDSCILEVLDSFRDRTVKLNLSPGDIRESRVVVFDKGLKTVACNPGFIKLFKAPYQEETFLRGKDLSFYAPDFEEAGHRANIRKKLGIKNLGGDLQRWLAAMEREEEPLSAAGSAETNGDLAGRI